MVKYYYGTAKNVQLPLKLYWLRTASDDTESGLNAEQMQINSDHFANLFDQSRKKK